MKDKTPKYSFTQEVRFAVVMYGGVSLAIYINGVTQELLHLVRATAPGKDKSGTALLSNDELTGTERVYRKLGQMLAKGEPVCEGSDTIRTRFVIDILSGTSAGGINAVFLAKALANDQRIDQLKDLWINEGDIGLLINDAKAVEGLGLSARQPPSSLLSSQRMYYKLLSAFDGMEENRQSDGRASSPYIEELDLFVTATDIQGMPLPIRLADGVVYERRHRNVFRFAYRSPEVTADTTHSRSDEPGKTGLLKPWNDFLCENDPFLAFAARCTSSFPFAFEPMSLADMDDVLPVFPRYRDDACRSDSKRWERFFEDYLRAEGTGTAPFSQRAFGDGGYLDNKPFSYAIEMLLKRQADCPVDRKLIYIEPSPDHPEDEKEPAGKPDAIENVMAALITLPGYETIREDLRAVLEQNRLIERIGRITKDLDLDVAVEKRSAFQRSERQKPVMPGTEWAEKDLSEMIGQYGVAYGGYHRLKVGMLTEELADLITSLSGFDLQSDYATAVLYLVRVWRSHQYTLYREEGTGREYKWTENRFLIDFDLSYRMRRLNYLRNRLDWLCSIDWRSDKTVLEDIRCGDLDPALLKTEGPAFRAALVKVKPKINEAFRILRIAKRSISMPTGESPLLSRLPEHTITAEHLRRLLEEVDEKTRLKHAEALLLSSGLLDRMNRFAEKLAEVLKPAMDKSSKLCKAVLNPSDAATPAEAHAKGCLQHYFNTYERYDMITLPILNYAHVGELDPVEVIRISPEDAKGLIDERKERRTTGRQKLAGISFGHFGAFLEKAWRVNDILWGRLDGAERIISAMLPGRVHEELRTKLIREAHEAIIREDMTRDDRTELCGLLVDGIMSSGAKTPEEVALLGLAEAKAGEQVNQKLVAILRSLLTEKDILEFFKTGYQVNRTPNPQRLLASVSRSSQVVGKMLEGIADKYHRKDSVAWIARLGQIFWGFVTVATPGSIWNILGKHWLKALYVLEALLIVLAVLFGKQEVRSLGLLAVAITLTANLAVWTLTDYMRGRNRVLRFILLVIGLSIGFFTVAGMDRVFDWGLKERFIQENLAQQPHIVREKPAIKGLDPQ